MKRTPKWAATRRIKTGFIAEIFKMANDAERENFYGTTDNNLRGNGSKARKTVSVSGVPQRETTTRANGATISKTARDTSSTMAAPNIAGISATFSSTARERSSSSTAINTAAPTSTGNPTATEDIRGLMEMSIKGSS